MIEIELEDRVLVFPVEGLVKTQALWRGAVVRKHFHRLRKEYEALFIHIEESNQAVIQWKPCLVSAPIIPKKKTYNSRTAAIFKAEGKSAISNNGETSEQKQPKAFEEKDRSAHNLQKRDDSLKSGTTCVCHNVNQASQDVGAKETDIISSNAGVTFKSNRNEIEHKQNFSDEEARGEISESRKTTDCSMDKFEESSVSSSNISYLKGRRISLKSGTQELHNTGGELPKDNTMSSLMNQTSIWDSELSEDLATQLESYKNLDKVSLETLRSNTAMELLWVQQAITSRKQYLSLVNGIDQPISS